MNVTDQEIEEMANMLDDPAESAPAPAPVAEPDEVKASEEQGVEEVLASSDADDGVVDDDVVDGDPDQDAADGSEGDDKLVATGDDAADSADDAYTIASLAEAIEIEQGELYNVLVPMEGESDPISIGEMKNNYQLAMREQETSQQQLEEQATKIQELEQGITAPQMISQVELQARLDVEAVNKEYNETDWADLDEYSPGESALKRQQLQQRFNKANNDIATIRQQQDQERDEMLTTNFNKMLELVPEWKEKETRAEDMRSITKLMVDSGYTEEDAAAISDPIAMSMLHRLATLEARNTAAKTAVKKVRKKPTVLSTKAAMPKPNPNKGLEDRFNAAKSGSLDDKVDALIGFL